jgi:predicted MFS family arabinose efflux permease
MLGRSSTSSQLPRRIVFFFSAALFAWAGFVSAFATFSTLFCSRVCTFCFLVAGGRAHDGF